MIRRTHGLDYATYLKGDGWKCGGSPTGAHHWIVGRHDSVCKYCQVNSSAKPSDPVIGLTPGTIIPPETP